MCFFGTLKLESISIRGIFSYKVATTETTNLVFVLLDNDLIIGNYGAIKNVLQLHEVIVNNRKQNVSKNKNILANQ